MSARLRGPWEAAARRKAKSGRPWRIGGLEEHLLVLLLYYRCYVTQEFLGFFYRVDRSVICRAIRRVEAQVRPLLALRREPRVSAEEAEALIIDCTEQPIQRPKDQATQRAHYSGEEKRHTLKTEYIAAGSGRIVSVSDSHPGSRHDLTIRKVYQCLHPMRYTRAEISLSRFGRPLYLELDLLFVLAPFVLDIADGANRDRYPLARNLDLEAPSVFQGVGKPPQLLDELRQRVVLLDVSFRLLGHLSLAEPSKEAVALSRKPA